MKTFTTSSVLKSWAKLLPAGLLAASMLFTSCGKEEVEPQASPADVKAVSNSEVKQASTPTIKCISSTETSITIEVKAGAGGAPGGFTVQWKKEGEDWSKCLTKSYDYCLKPYECKIICIDKLECGKCYVIRASANSYTKDGCYYACSPYSCEIKCHTKECPKEECNKCTYTQGYWKNHPSAWPVDHLYIGGERVEKAKLLEILKTPVQGNGVIQLEHQLIAAKLNYKKNNCAPEYATDAIDAADALLTGKVYGTLPTSQTSNLNETLTRYNESNHCD
ncbi:hypothetical protein [Hymenobacter sp. BT730]|uniref:hypothetical protein n=1 Tax=Hymenobacter sp. BT730 TaxID=3063332 RepID=UPI0026DECB52|nr:hypothetical protein [Hymenobacter sp. BT730]